MRLRMHVMILYRTEASTVEYLNIFSVPTDESNNISTNEQLSHSVQLSGKI
jgi:hypothetical protein